MAETDYFKSDSAKSQFTMLPSFAKAMGGQVPAQFLYLRATSSQFTMLQKDAI